jgi:hypothetical protein
VTSRNASPKHPGSRIAVQLLAKNEREKKIEEKENKKDETGSACRTEFTSNGSCRKQQFLARGKVMVS